MNIKKVFAWILAVSVSMSSLPADLFAAMEIMQTEEALFGDIPMVYLATMSEESLEKAAGIVSVVTSEEIEKTGARSLIDVLDMLPGIETLATVHAVQVGRFRSAGGVYGAGLLFMIDGIPLNDVLSGGAFWSYADRTLTDVERIEIIRGPGSALYGENAFSGVINIVTKKASDIRGLEVVMKGGSFKNKGGSILYGGEWEDLEISLSLDHFNTDGYKKTVERDALFGSPLAQTPGDTRSDKEHYTGRFHGAYKNWEINIGAQKAIKNNLIGVTRVITTEPSDPNYAIWHSYYTSLKYTYEAGPLTIVPEVKYVYDEFAFRLLLFPPNYTIPLDLDGDGDIEVWPEGFKGAPGRKDTRLMGETKVYYEGFDKHLLLFGVSYGEAKQYDVIDHPRNFGVTVPSKLDTFDSKLEESWNINANRYVTGIYAQDKISFTEDFSFTLGARYNSYNDIGDSFNPRASMVWSVSDSVDAKVLYGSAFRVPNFITMYNANNPSAIGNKDLKPETIDTYEAALYYKPDTKGTLLSANVFYNKISDLVRLRLASPGVLPVYVNTGEQRIYGIETELKTDLPGPLSGSFSYSYAEGKDKTSKVSIKDISPHKATMNINCRVMNGLNWNVSSFYHSQKIRDFGDVRKGTKDFVVTNTTLVYNWTAFMKVSLSVFNMFNTYYVTPDPQDVIYNDFPRSSRDIRGEVSYKF